MTFRAALEPPYYAVIFSATRTEDDNEYGETSARMEALAKTMPGYLGFEAVRNADGFGIAISYWESEEAISNWKRQAAHQHAQQRGRKEWYTDYCVHVARVERCLFASEQLTHHEH